MKACACLRPSYSLSLAELRDNAGIKLGAVIDEKGKMLV
jgi:hypothetical protein